MQQSDRSWFITGASSGFGRALAEAVLERGERAVIAARRKEPLAALAARHPGRALPLELDVTDPAAREHAVAEALRRFGGIDILANVAGRGSLGAVEEFGVDELRQQMEVNFFAAAELTRLVLPGMRARRSGHILNLTSIGGLISVGGFGAYCASKFALEAWSEALRDEVAALGIRVTLVEPGNFRTEFAGSSNMRPEKRIDDYRPVITPIEDFLYGQDGLQPGDPAKAARAMIAVVGEDDPPIHLLLGADAYDVWDRVGAATKADIDRYRAIGMQTGFDGVDFRPIGATD